ncbi:MAG: BON domain-containing protein [Pseudomonadales bacterium]
MVRALIVIVGLASLGLLIWFCVDQQVPRIEGDLRKRATAVLVEGGFADIIVTADGRDLRLNGTVASEAARAEARRLLRKVNGIRAVDNQLRVLELVELGQPEPLSTASALPDESESAAADGKTLKGAGPQRRSAQSGE